MDHILVRRLAILLAAFSFSALMTTVLVYSAGTGQLQDGDQEVAVMETQAPVKAYSFPFQIDNTALIARNLALYDGPFYEDGSGREVFEVAALVAQNSSGEMLWHYNIELYIEGEKYIFEGMLLPPYATVLIPEKNAKDYKTGTVNGCNGVIDLAEQPPTLPICVNITGMDRISIQNISEYCISDAVMYHKTYMSDAAMYIGGMAFQTMLPSIAPGQQITVNPANFAAGYSQLLCIYSS